MTAGDRQKTPQLRVVNDRADDPAAAVDRLISGGGATVEIKPQLRADLVVGEAGSDRVLVRTPEGVTPFPIYLLEWSIAKLMDGTRTTSEISALARSHGVAATPDLVRSFTRELVGYRFLLGNEAVGAALREVGAQPAERQEVSVEEQQLMATANALCARSDFDAAIDYLLAVLEINPANEQARASIREIQSQAQTASRLGRPTAPRAPALPGLRPLNRRKLLVSAGVVASLLLLVLGLVLGARVIFRGRLEPGANTAAALNDSLTFRVVVGPLEIHTVNAPDNGHIQTGDWALGASVAQGATLAQWWSPKDFVQLEQIRKKSERLDAEAHPDKVYQYFSSQQRRRLERQRAKIKSVAILAPAAGVLRPLVSGQSDVVRAQGLFEIGEVESLTARVPLSGLPFPIERASCGVKQKPEVRCRVELLNDVKFGSSVLQFIFDNAGRTIEPGRPLDVTVWRGPDRQP